MTEDSFVNKLELHYFFNDFDKTHSMDAVVRNKCEHELLQIIGTISKELNIHIKVETEAYDQGGLKELYTFLCTVEGQTIILLSNLAVTALGIIISSIPLKKTRLDKLEQNLCIEEKKLNIEVQKLNLVLIKKELKEKKIETTNINIEKLDYIITNNIKILKHKSNFYKALTNYPKVNRLSTAGLYEDKKRIAEPKIIERKDFEKFILDSDILEPIQDDNATIEIISPVLKKGKYKWRGIYNKVSQPIEFSMRDKEFKDGIIERGTTFKSGTFLDCIIEISRKIDDLGNVFNNNYVVVTVLRQHEEGIITETSKGKKIRQKREAEKSQFRLFDDTKKHE
ncbi:MAG: hypothetical protein ABIJ97_17440 [Bacteroidota bacterium]